MGDSFARDQAHALAHRSTEAALNGPDGSSTTNDAVPGKRWFCQFAAVPYGHAIARYVMASPAVSAPWMQPTTSSRTAAAGEPRTIAWIRRPSPPWPTGSRAQRAARRPPALNPVPCLR